MLANDFWLVKSTTDFFKQLTICQILTMTKGILLLQPNWMYYTGCWIFPHMMMRVYFIKADTNKSQKRLSLWYSVCSLTKPTDSTNIRFITVSPLWRMHYCGKFIILWAGYHPLPSSPITKSHIDLCWRLPWSNVGIAQPVLLFFTTPYAIIITLPHCRTAKLSQSCPTHSWVMTLVQIFSSSCILSRYLLALVFWSASIFW